ncbi:hypothetical protein J1614_012203 [Plenodomus biglobosus]|nr:hypothetical protein J1614_012203 [Plenodomus biglobosus]
MSNVPRPSDNWYRGNTANSALNENNIKFGLLLAHDDDDGLDNIERCVQDAELSVPDPSLSLIAQGKVKRQELYEALPDQYKSRGIPQKWLKDVLYYLRGRVVTNEERRNANRVRSAATTMTMPVLNSTPQLQISPVRQGPAADPVSSAAQIHICRREEDGTWRIFAKVDMDFISVLSDGQYQLSWEQLHSVVSVHVRLGRLRGTADEIFLSPRPDQDLGIVEEASLRTAAREALSAGRKFIILTTEAPSSLTATRDTHPVAPLPDSGQTTNEGYAITATPEAVVSDNCDSFPNTTKRGLEEVEETRLSKRAKGAIVATEHERSHDKISEAEQDTTNEPNPEAAGMAEAAGMDEDGISHDTISQAEQDTTNEPNPEPAARDEDELDSNQTSARSPQGRQAGHVEPEDDGLDDVLAKTEEMEEDGVGGADAADKITFA